MRIIEWQRLDQDGRAQALARPAQASRAELLAATSSIIDTVRRDGDAALRAFTEQFDGARIESLQVSAGEFSTARATLQPSDIRALERAIENVRTFHEAQLPQALALDTMPGVRCERLIRPIDAVGLYVPAGAAPLPSAVVMLAVPAKIAGCPQRVLCTAPTRDGRANAAVLVAAQLCGIETVFKVGGAQAIAALAYGTESVPKVHKIFGPGSARVTAAKQIVASDPDGASCDLPAGPSEVLVVADESASAELVASDLLAQAEHDVQAQAVLVTTSPELATATLAAIGQQLDSLSRRSILEQSLASSRCIVVADLPTAIAVANEYAAEHLILQVRAPREALAQ